MIIKLVDVIGEKKLVSLVKTEAIRITNLGSFSGIILYTTMGKDIFIKYDDEKEENRIMANMTKKFREGAKIVTMIAPDGIDTEWLNRL
jgi:hypothetical protein